MNKTMMTFAGVLALAAGSAFGQARDAEQGESAGSTALTIYSTAQPGGVPAEWYRPVPGQYQGFTGPNVPGYAIVKRERAFEFEEGIGEISLQGVAALIDPTTVRFESLDSDETSVLEQDYRFDLVSQQRLLERYIDQPITVRQTQGAERVSISGTLLSASGALILQQNGGGVVTVSDYDTVEFPDLPGGLLTRPTLVWKTQSAEAGEQSVRVTYETQGITWWADYNLVFAPGETANSGTLDVGAWVSILNQSGGTYEDAKLKLIAGDVNRAPTPRPYPERMMTRGMTADTAEMGFEEKSFFEYHLYTLGRLTTIPDNSTKQIELFEPARDVPAEKVLVYDGARLASIATGGRYTDQGFTGQGNTKVEVYLRFQNDEDVGLGIPLPKGRIRVSQLDAADGSLEFIGEDVIDHTPRDEEVLIRLGDAFDVVGERKQVDFTIDHRAHIMTETIEISLRNRKDEAVDVIARETMYRWTNWEIVETTHEPEKQNSRTVHFPVRLSGSGGEGDEVTIRYTVRYTW